MQQPEGKGSRMTKSNRLLFPREESSYRNMMSRCYNPNATKYEYYGGKGIRVHPSWVESFSNFYKDMGPRPEGTSLDRLDNDLDYGPDNCRWSTRREQRLNRSDVHLVTFNGETLSLTEWAERIGVRQNTITYRLKRGWSIERALTEGKIHEEL